MDKNICTNDDNVEPADAGRGEERVVISTDWLLWGGGDGNDGDDGDDDDDDDDGDDGDDGNDDDDCDDGDVDEKQSRHP